MLAYQGCKAYNVIVGLKLKLEKEIIMTTGTKIVVGVLASVLMLAITIGGIAFSAYSSYHDLGNRTESLIQAEYQRSQNVMSQTATTVMDVAKIADNYAEQVHELVEATMQGRYGEDGSEAVVQWIQEQNVTVDSEMYRDISRVVQSGRQDFANAQNRVIDVKRSYQTNLGGLWSGFWLNVAGYPKINLDDYNIILDATTTEKFETGVDSGFIQ